MVIPQFSIKHSCPFCLSRPVMEKTSLDRGNGHGYPGNYTYKVACQNAECKIRPETHAYDDIYRKEEEAIKLAIADWDFRPGYVGIREPIVTNGGQR